MSNVLFGAVCLDIYNQGEYRRPGCGILHNAYHLQKLGANPLLITRIGEQQAAFFLDFFHTHQIAILPEQITAPGAPASIYIRLEPSGEAQMSHFAPGVWHDFLLTAQEEEKMAQATNLHMVMLHEVAPEFLRLSVAGKLKQTLISADFLALHHFSMAQFVQMLAHVHIAFIGWRGALDDPMLETIRTAAQDQRTLVIITFGAQGIQVFDGLTTSQLQTYFFPVEAVPVLGNTNGCGDAFISYFLAEYWPSHNLEAAISQGKIGGALATAWPFALPATAYPHPSTSSPETEKHISGEEETALLPSSERRSTSSGEG